MTRAQRLKRRIEKARRRLEDGRGERVELRGPVREQDVIKRLEKRLSSMNGPSGPGGE